MAALLVGMPLAGCATTMATPATNSGGRFQTTVRLTSAQVLVTAPFDRAKTPVVYVRASTGAPALDRFFVESVKATGQFETVLDSQQLQERVIAWSKETGNSASFVDSNAGLYEFSKRFGPLLVVEPSVEWIGGYDYESGLRAFDTTTGQTVFLARNKAFNWAGLDQPLFYPLFNAFIDWTQGVAPPPPAARPRS